MAEANRSALLKQGLARAAARLGDVTPAVMAAFYARHPQARDAFDRLALGRRQGLEGEMVAQVLYCAMTWPEQPGEVEMVLLGSVPHHASTLDVRPEWYAGLIAAGCAVLGGDAVAEERAMWDEIEAELLQVVRESAG
ncbi:MAG: hypothetical protein KGM17_02105 [Sphingomonadales bacterium]|nr:hypothetical protein [Sphingomonadales bacterium]